MASPVKPKPAASLVITRQKKKNLYVLMGQRPKNSKFAPNVWVFPGGKVEKYDSLNKDIKLNKKILTDLKKLKANNLLSSALISAALRETYEETGLKLINKKTKIRLKNHFLNSNLLTIRSIIKIKIKKLPIKKIKFFTSKKCLNQIK